MLKCDMCHKPLKGVRYRIERGTQTLVVGPECYRKEKKAAEDLEFRNRPEFDDFCSWMRETNASNRPCPAGDFPNNFTFWLDGGRW